MKKNNLRIIIFIVFVSLLNDCSDKKDQTFGIKYNKERIEIGIPIVESYWDACSPYESLIIWGSDKDKLDSIAKHATKTIKIVNGKRIMEEDCFDKRLNDSTIQQIIIKYSFEEKKNSWNCQNIIRTKKKVNFYGIDKMIADEAKMLISRQEAINKLTEWGLNKGHILGNNKSPR